MVRKTVEQKETINNLEKFYKHREEGINFFRDYIDILSDANYNAKKNETKGKGLKIALAQVKAGNNSESLLNEIRQIALYQSKQITIKVYNNIIKFINI